MTTNTRKSVKPTVPLGEDMIHDLLSAERRRIALDELDADGPLTKRELIDAIARRQYGVRPDSDERKRVAVSMHQCHLPKLTDTDVLKKGVKGYDVGANADDLLAYLEYSPARGGVRAWLGALA